MKNRLFALVIALQCAWVLGTVAVQETRLRSGTTVLLETRPVDPRDLLRGDYVILQYDVETLPRELLEKPESPEPAPGTTVYVTLAPRGAFHAAAKVSFAPPKDPTGPVLRGRVVSSDWRAGHENHVRAEYGIDRYYVREGTGEVRGKLTVEIALGRDGTPAIRQVFVDGKPFAEAARQQVR